MPFNKIRHITSHFVFDRSGGAVLLESPNFQTPKIEDERASILKKSSSARKVRLDKTHCLEIDNLLTPNTDVTTPAQSVTFTQDESSKHISHNHFKSRKMLRRKRGSLPERKESSQALIPTMMDDRPPNSAKRCSMCY